MMATTIIILLSIAIVLLIILVAWLVWRNQHQHDELQEKNRIIVREVQRRFALNGRTITAIFTLCGILSFFSCAVDNPIVEPDSDSHHSFGGDPTNYNINDSRIFYSGMYREPFTSESWRTSEGLFLYVGGQGYDTSIHDANGSTGYIYVNLPWSEAASVNNIPERIWEEIITESGWDLVMRHCGNRSTAYGNFLGFYNKYTGVLRCFYYMPDKFITAANYHLWEVRLHDYLSSHSVFGYGVPSNSRIVDKQRLQGTSGNLSHVVSSWADRSANYNSCLIPTAGWWAFDIDLSLYRSEDIINIKSFQELVHMTLLGSNTSASNLTNVITSALKGKGNIKLEESHISTEGGVFCFLDEYVKPSIEWQSLGGDAKSLELADAYNHATNAMKNYASIQGIDTGDRAIGSDGNTGNFSLDFGINARMETRSTIQSLEPFSGAPTPTLKLHDFDFENSTFGQGVWNIKNNPVVYLTDQNIGISYDADNPMTSIFGGVKNGSARTMIYPHQGMLYFFDPSSIEVELNPNVFPDDCIEEVVTSAVCYLHNSENVFESTDKYRTSFGLGDRKFSSPFTTSILPWAGSAFNFLYGYDEQVDALDLGNQIHRWPLVTYQRKTYGIAGTGDDEFLLEPQMLTLDDETSYMPALEVMVYVCVKTNLTDEAGNKKSFYYSRKYLPEYKTIQKGPEFDNLLDKIKQHPATVKNETKGFFYLLEEKRLESFFEFPKEIVSSSSYPTTADTELEFKSDKPFVPNMYTILSPTSINNITSWTLSAKKNEGDQWTVIDKQDPSLPSYHSYEMRVNTDGVTTYNIEKPGLYQYFRLEWNTAAIVRLKLY